MRRPTPAHWAAGLAANLPGADLESLAAATLEGPDALVQLAAISPTAVLRAACEDARQYLRGGSAPPFLAGALMGTAALAQHQRAGAGIDVVWTGPQSHVATSRLTSSVVVELIDSAVQEILLVSFATQSEPTIDVALRRASQRGVTLTLLLERPEDNPNYSAREAFAGLTARRLVWPAAHRPPGAAIHAKVLVVDARAALVGSANITGHAMTRNLECGVLIRGGEQPGRIRDHILGLRETGALEGA